MAKLSKAQQKRLLIEIHKKSIKLGLHSTLTVNEVQSINKVCRSGLRKLGYTGNELK